MKLYYFLFLLLSIGYSQFNWIDGGLPIRQGVHVEWMRTAAEDDGTLIIVWSDTRNGVRDMYAQKINSNGDFLWGDGGAAPFSGHPLRFLVRRCVVEWPQPTRNLFQ